MGLNNQIKTIFPSIHPKHQAELIEALESDERRQLVQIVENGIKSTLLIKLSKKTRYEIIGYMTKQQIAVNFVKLIGKEAVIQDVEKDIADIDEEDNMFETIWHSIRSRIPWLICALCLGSVSSLIVNQFTDMIEKFVVLSALMPLISNLSGVSGTQTVGILIRDLARCDNVKSEAKRTIFREALIGLVNGFVIALSAAIGVYLWKHNSNLSFSFFLTVWLLEFLSPVFGAIIPIGLYMLGFDPALGSNAVITVLLDMLSYFLLFGVAMLILL